MQYGFLSFINAHSQCSIIDQLSTVLSLIMGLVKCKVPAHYVLDEYGQKAKRVTKARP